VTRLLALLLLSFDGECGGLFPDLDGIYSDHAETCGLDVSLSVAPWCSMSDPFVMSKCLVEIEALTCEQLLSEVIPEACKNVCLSNPHSDVSPR
jgi:hypothetical protein